MRLEDFFCTDFKSNLAICLKLSKFAVDKL